MRQEPQVQLGVVARAYAHGYLVIWNEAEGRGFETDLAAFLPAEKRPKDATALAGETVAYLPARDGRRVEWFARDGGGPDRPRHARAR